MKKRNILALIFFLSILGCSESFRTDVTIRGCITSSGAELPVSAEITINGETKVWEPGTVLNFNTDIGGDIGFIEVSAFAEGYQALTDETYNIESSEGVEMILTFSEVKDIATLNTVDPEETDLNGNIDNNGTGTGEDDATGTITINSVPADILLYYSKVDDGTLENIRFSESLELTLPVGEYKWTAQSEGYKERNGTFRISEQERVERTIILDQDIVQASFSITTVPEDASIELIDTDSERSYRLVSGEQTRLSPGNYEYSVSKPGYIIAERSFTIGSGENEQFLEELKELSVESIVNQINGMSELNEAIQIYSILPGGVPEMSISQRTNYVEALYKLASYLGENNERDRAGNTLQKLLEINPRYIEGRWLYAEILKLQKDFDQAVGIVRPTMGAYSNDLPEPQRTEVRLETRFRLASIYYDRYQSLDESNINQRFSVGDRAIAALDDFIERYESVGEPERFRNDVESARILRRDISSDLGR